MGQKTSTMFGSLYWFILKEKFDLNLIEKFFWVIKIGKLIQLEV